MNHKCDRCGKKLRRDLDGNYICYLQTDNKTQFCYECDNLLYKGIDKGKENIMCEVDDV
jgi:hypothetical protein